VPPLPAAGVPFSTPVEALNETPLGNAPVSASVGAGDPLAVTVKNALFPAKKVASAALVIVGAMLTSRGRPRLSAGCDPPIPAVVVVATDGGAPVCAAGG